MNAIGGIRKEHWEKEKKTPFKPKCPHCKEAMEKVVAMPVMVTGSSEMPLSYALCCWECQTILHTVTGVPQTEDSHTQYQLQEQERDGLKKLIHKGGIQLETADIDQLVAHLRPEAIDRVYEMLRQKLGREAYNQFLVRELEELSEDKPSLKLPGASSNGN